ncbi:MAG: radical SAM protein [bacterium JZ-2024 1]
MNCAVCGKEKLVARILGICRECILEGKPEAWEAIYQAHQKARQKFPLPSSIPKREGGTLCRICSNECRFLPGETGYCGIHGAGGKNAASSARQSALLYAYLDPHITNCCASWFCPGGTGAGFPRWATCKGPELGFFNLAVFFYGCNFDCLFCQNSEHKNISQATRVEKEQFFSWLKREEKVTCVCFFGGSPEPHLPFVVEMGREIMRTYSERLIRICVEWNGCGNPALVERVAEIVLRSGGIIKFDLKCYEENLSRALSGVSNRRAYENFALLAEKYYPQRPELPLLTATTLLVPGYVEEEEVESIAAWIAQINEEIPYSLLVFYPAHYMTDLPVTPRETVFSAYRKAKKYLKNVHIGNLHLLL